MECKCSSGSGVPLVDWGFNRYIVECKSVIQALVDALPTDLIDTLWNVNQRDPGRSETYDADLIDTLWNVNVDV